jgi:hypothetical protein
MDYLWQFRDILRAHKLIPNWANFGVPFLMMAPTLYLILVFGIPTSISIILIWILFGFFWAVGIGTIVLVIIWFLQFMILQN